MASGPQNPNQAIDVMVPITIAHVIVMAALAIAALLAIWWGAVLHRRRRAAEQQVDRDFAVAEQHGATRPATVEGLGGKAVTPPAEAPGQDPAHPPAEIPEVAFATDLTQIKGLGPRLAVVLAAQGITRVAQIAALTPQQAVDLDAALGPFQGRMARDRWIEQAKLLNAGDRAGYEAAFGKLGE